MKAVKKKSVAKMTRGAKPAKPIRAAKPAGPSRPSPAVVRGAAETKAVVAKGAGAGAPSKGGLRGGANAVALRPVAPTPPPKPLVPVIGPKQIEVFRRLLLERKRGLAEMYNRNKTYGRLTEDEGTQDLADKASSAYTKEFLYSLSNTDREVLQKVDEALVRLETGGYGRCLECAAEINRKRLEAVPWASHCIVCQEKREKGLL